MKEDGLANKTSTAPKCPRHAAQCKACHMFFLETAGNGRVKSEIFLVKFYQVRGVMKYCINGCGPEVGFMVYSCLLFIVSK